MKLSTYVSSLKEKDFGKKEILLKAKAKVKKVGKRWTVGVQKTFDEAWKVKVKVPKEKKEKKLKVMLFGEGREAKVDKYIAKYKGHADKKTLRKLLLDTELKGSLLKRYPKTDGKVYSIAKKTPKEGAFIWRQEKDYLGNPSFGYPRLVLNTKPKIKINTNTMLAEIAKKGTYTQVTEVEKKAHILRYCLTAFTEPKDSVGKVKDGSYLVGDNVVYWQEYTSKFSVKQWENVRNAREKLLKGALKEQKDRAHANEPEAGN